jgi:polyisoprenyl-phosphate glycosyltransferase
METKDESGRRPERGMQMGTHKHTVSIVCPALNEEEVLPHFHDELCRVLASLDGEYDFEVLYVDDGSSDGSLDLMRDWARADARVRYVSLSRNFGHQAAFTAGLEHASGDAVILMDADLQHPPGLIPKLLAGWREGRDLVITLREGHRPPGLTRLASLCFSGLLRRLSPLRLRPRMSDFMLLSRPVVDELLRLRETHRYLRGMIQWLGYSAGEVAYRVPPRKAGRTKFNLPRLMDYSLDAILSFSRVPLRLAFVLGAIFLLIGVCVGGWAMLGLLVPGCGAGGWSAWLLASVHLVGGAVLGGLGLLGEYLGRVFEQVKGRPLYLVRETEQEGESVRPRREVRQWRRRVGV